MSVYAFTQNRFGLILVQIFIDVENRRTKRQKSENDGPFILIIALWCLSFYVLLTFACVNISIYLLSAKDMPLEFWIRSWGTFWLSLPKGESSLPYVSISMITASTFYWLEIPNHFLKNVALRQIIFLTLCIWFMFWKHWNNIHQT